MNNVSKFVNSCEAVAKTKIINQAWMHLPQVCKDFAHGQDLRNINREAIAFFCERYGNTCTKDIEANCTNEILDAYLTELGPRTIKSSSDLYNVKARAIVYRNDRILNDNIREIFKVVFLERYLDISGTVRRAQLDGGIDALWAAIEDLTPCSDDILEGWFVVAKLLDQLMERMKGMARAS